MTAIPQDEPLFQISVVAKIIGVHQQTIRSYERLGLVQPARSIGNTRLFSTRDIDQLGQIVSWTTDLGLNLAGVEIMMRLHRQIKQLEETNKTLTADVEALREQLTEMNHDSENTYKAEKEYGADFFLRFS
ncbi:MAG: MerR family transcriptional regulator [Dehalococcoidia bacterium]|nr:MerR family transcriptional regulator [Dehalococcoidia bacterium]